MPKMPAPMYRQSDLFLVLFFVFFRVVIVFFFLVGFVLIFLFLVLLFIQVVGNGIVMDGLRLGHFQFGFTLWAAQNFNLLDFVLIPINFGAILGAANHGTILLRTNPAEP